jgi:hypothetical protein
VSPEGTDSLLLLDPGHHRYYLLVRETLLGLALGRATNGGQPLGHEAAVLEALRRGADALAAPHGPPPG